MDIEYYNVLYNINTAARFDLAIPKHVAVLTFYKNLFFLPWPFVYILLCTETLGFGLYFTVVAFLYR